MSAVLSRQTEALANIFGQLNRLDRLEDDVISLLPSLTDDEIIETRTYARGMGKTAWKIEIACDAEIWNRSYARRGRGNKDEAETGIMASVNKRAAELGCGASTIRKNAQLFNEFKTVLSVEHILDDKGFYQAALSAPNPQKMVQEIARRKAANPLYSVRDAWRDVDGQKTRARTGGDKSDMPALLKAHIERTVAKIEKEIIPDCPDGTFARRFYSEWLNELRFELHERGIIDNQEKLIDAYDQGYRTDEALQKVTGIARGIILQILGDRLGWEKVREGGKTEMARGDRRWIWRKPGEVLGSDAQIPRVEEDDDY